MREVAQPHHLSDHGAHHGVVGLHGLEPLDELLRCSGDNRRQRPLPRPGASGGCSGAGSRLGGPRIPLQPGPTLLLLRRAAC